VNISGVINQNARVLGLTQPVEILNFDAGVVDNKYVQVIWQTYSESNSDRFFVEKSSNGRDWIYVGEIVAACIQIGPSIMSCLIQRLSLEPPIIDSTKLILTDR